MNDLTLRTSQDTYGRSSGIIDVATGGIDTSVKILAAGLNPSHRWLFLAHTHYQTLNSGAVPEIYGQMGPGNTVLSTYCYHKLPNTGKSRWYCTAWIAQPTGNDVILILRNIGTSSTTVRYQQAGICAIDLDSAGTAFQQISDWDQNVNAVISAPLNNTFGTSGATVTFTANGSDTYLLIGSANMREHDASVPVGKYAHMRLYEGAAVLAEHKIGSDSRYPNFTERCLDTTWVLQPSAGSHTYTLKFAGDSIWNHIQSFLCFIKLSRFEKFVTDLYQGVSTGCYTPAGCSLTNISDTAKPDPQSPSRTWGRIDLFQMTIDSPGITERYAWKCTGPTPGWCETPTGANDYMVAPFAADIVSMTGFGALAVEPDFVRAHALNIMPETVSPGIDPIVNRQSLRWWLQLKSVYTPVNTLDMAVGQTFSKVPSVNIAVAENKTQVSNLDIEIASVKTRLVYMNDIIAQTISLISNLEVLAAQTNQISSSMDIARSGTEYRTLLTRVLIAAYTELTGSLNILAAVTQQLSANLNLQISDSAFIVIEEDRPETGALVTVSDLETGLHPNSVRSVVVDFGTSGVVPGDILEILGGFNQGNYVVLAVLGHELFTAEAQLTPDLTAVPAVVRKQKAVIPQLKAAVVIDQPVFNAGVSMYSLVDIVVA